MEFKIGDTVRIKYDFNDHEEGDLFRVIGFRTSFVTGREMCDVVKLKNNTKCCGLYPERFELVKNNNKDIY